MNDTQVFGCLLAALGVWIAATSRGAFDWWSNGWRVSADTTDAWFAMLMGPRIVNTFHFLLGIVCAVGGALLALGVS